MKFYPFVKQFIIYDPINTGAAPVVLKYDKSRADLLVFVYCIPIRGPVNKFMSFYWLKYAENTLGEKRKYTENNIL